MTRVKIKESIQLQEENIELQRQVSEQHMTIKNLSSEKQRFEDVVQNLRQDLACLSESNSLLDLKIQLQQYAIDNKRLIELLAMTKEFGHLKVIPHLFFALVTNSHV